MGRNNKKIHPSYEGFNLSKLSKEHNLSDIRAGMDADGVPFEEYEDQDTELMKALKTTNAKDVMVVDEYFDDESEDGYAFFNWLNSGGIKANKKIMTDMYFDPKENVVQLQDAFGGYVAFFMLTKTLKSLLKVWAKQK